MVLRSAAGDDHGDATLNQIGGHCRQAVEFYLPPSGTQSRRCGP
jgi:hypothetical protein